MVGKEPWHQSDVGGFYCFYYVFSLVSNWAEIWLMRGGGNRDEILDACFTRLTTTTTYMQ